MKSMFRDVLEIIRPFGVRRLALVSLVTLIQALVQLVAVFMLVPFLSAATNPAQFRVSGAGVILQSVFGSMSDHRMAITTGVISLVALIVGNVIAVYGDFIRTHYAYDLAHWLRQRVLKNFLSRRYEYFLSVNSAHLLKNTVDDIGVFVSSVLLPVLDICARGAVVFLMAVAVLVMEPIILVAAAVLVFLYVLAFVRPIRRKAAQSSSHMLVLLRALYTEVNQIFVGIKPVMASGRASFFIERIAKISLGYSREMPRIPLYSSLPRSALEVLVFGGIILWVLLTIIGGGDLVSIMPRVGVIGLVAYRMMPSLQAISSQTMAITSSRQAMDEVLRVFREQSAHSDHDNSFLGDGSSPDKLEWKDSIRLEHVSFTYSGAELPALSDIDINIPKGAHVAFVGPTGSGKSTIVDLLLGLLSPTSGRILIDGEVLAPERVMKWRRAVGYVPQDLFLYDATVAENVAFGPPLEHVDMGRVREVARVAHASEFIERPQTLGYLTLVGERGVRLSGGQRQRLALARALHDRPNVLVLDEATSALDPRTEQGVVESLGIGAERLTVITVTHRLHTIHDYDRIYFVQHGRIVAAGTYDELQSHPAFREFSN